MLLALSVAIHYLESLIPDIVPIPGFRMGLANVVGLFVLYYYGGLSYLFVLFLRVILVGAISTGFGISFLMSLSGAVLSSAVSLLLYYLVKPSIYILSMASALAHTIGQLVAYAIFFASPYIFTYVMILGPLSLATGLLLAFFVRLLVQRLPRSFLLEEKKRRSQ